MDAVEPEERERLQVVREPRAHEEQVRADHALAQEDLAQRLPVDVEEKPRRFERPVLFVTGHLNPLAREHLLERRPRLVQRQHVSYSTYSTAYLSERGTMTEAVVATGRRSADHHGTTMPSRVACSGGPRSAASAA